MDGTEVGIGVAVVAGLLGLGFLAYKEGWFETFGGTEVSEVNSWLKEDCSSIVQTYWNDRTDAQVNNQIAADQFLRDTDPQNSWTGDQLEKRYFTEAGSLIGNALGGLFNGAIKGSSDGNGGDAGGEKVNLTSNQRLEVDQLRAAVLAKQAECAKEEAVWYSELQNDFLNMIDYMAMQIAQNVPPPLITHEKAQEFFSKNQVTLPAKLMQAEMVLVYQWIDLVNAAYKPMPKLSLTGDQFQKVVSIVKGYMCMQLYTMLLYYDNGHFEYPLSGAPPEELTSAPPTCFAMLTAINKAGLSGQAADLALAPCYWLTRVNPFLYDDRAPTVLLKSTPYFEAAKAFSSPTVAGAKQMAVVEAVNYANQKLSNYYGSNPSAGPLWFQDTCRQAFVNVGVFTKDEINAAAAQLWNVQVARCKAVKLPAYVPV